MAVTAVSGTGSTTATMTTLQRQLVKDQQQLTQDVAAAAEASVIAADQAAVVADQSAIAAEEASAAADQQLTGVTEPDEETGAVGSGGTDTDATSTGVVTGIDTYV